jgi:cephalosporin hydroxylase
MIREWLFNKGQGLRRRLGLPLWTDPLAPFRSNDASLIDQTDSDLARAFFAHRGRPVFKWVHYLDLYERHFAHLRGTAFTMLEIGVSQGGSLELWREYFGDQAVICGIDIDPDCAAKVDPPNLVRIGSQDDPDFLRGVAAELGELDLVLDDGSHIGRHQQASFETLWPLVKPGGLYVIEDLHTSYWGPTFEGRYGRRGTGVELVKQLFDDMHGWYHDRGEQLAARDAIGAIHAYDSIVFIEKVRRPKPATIIRPDPAAAA